MTSIVVAYDQNRAIGMKGQLPWGRELPSDLKHFRSLTIGKSIIMGYNTFESIGAKPLPKRENIVVTHRNLVVDGVIAVPGVEKAFETAKFDPVVIGGMSLFLQTIGEIDTIYATEIKHRFSGTDTFFPELDGKWLEIERTKHEANTENKYTYDFVTYQKTPQIYEA